MKSIIEKQVREHGEQLNALFGTNHDPVKLCRVLHRLERQAHQAAEIDEKTVDFTCNEVLSALNRLFDHAKTCPMIRIEVTRLKSPTSLCAISRSVSKGT